MAKYYLSVTEVEILPMNPLGTDLDRQRHNMYLCNTILTQARKDDGYEAKEITYKRRFSLELAPIYKNQTKLV